MSPTVQPTRALDGFRPLHWLAFLLLHAPLALVMDRVSFVGTTHALGVVAAGTAVSLFSRRTATVVYVAAYIAGSEVLWRTCKANPVWEYGKYGLIAVLLPMLLRTRAARPGLGAVYFLLLLPSAALTLAALGPSGARGPLSFNLSGPLCICICTWYFADRALSWDNVRKLLLCLAAPIVGTLAIALFATATVEDLKFGTGSNAAAAGGFGPNQVSSMLGLGALVCFLLFILLRGKLPKIVLLGVTGACAVQSALTFSRGGLLTGALAAVACVFYLARSRRRRAQVLAAAAVLVGAGYFFVFPRLEAFTEGKITERFSDTSTTGRAELAEEDMQLFLDNPVLGVGPGMAADQRELLDHVAAHTELTRLFSEHGMLGIGALLVLVVMAARAVARQPDIGGKAFAAAFAVWTFLFMTHAALRMAAPAFIIGLATAALGATQRRPPVPAPAAPRGPALPPRTGPPRRPG